MNEELREQAAALPRTPGVYLFKDEAGRILYVGKAVDLRARVRSYFHEGVSPRTARMLEQAAAVDYVACDTEVEALILESNFIKQYRPRYNVRLRDDKRYPFVRVSVQEEFPAVHVTRRLARDGARYFGPFADSSALRKVLRLLQIAFPLRTCGRKVTDLWRSDRTITDAEEAAGRVAQLPPSARPCLNWQLGRCCAPCAGLVSMEDYARMARELCQVLEGRSEGLRKRLEREMREASERLEYERAARLRDMLEAVERIAADQKVAGTRGGDEDYVALAREGEGEEGDRACVALFIVRGGRVVAQEEYHLSGLRGMSDSEALGAFAKQHYLASPLLPRLVCLSHPIEDAEALAACLTERRGSRVEVRVPTRGAKRRLLAMAQANARLRLAQQRVSAAKRRERAEEALSQLAEVLGLPAPPVRVEAFDVSNILGQEAVGSLVVFESGMPRKEHYRRFKVKTVAGADDFAMMAELVRRRFAGSLARELPEPDLILIDGGRGQVSSALSALAEAGRSGLAVVGLAKRREELWLPGRSEPLRLPEDSPALLLLRHLRDEAHRFAVSYHRGLRGKRLERSVLDEVEGIGPAKKRALLQFFGSLEAIRKATVEELTLVRGIDRGLAERLWLRLRQEDAGAGRGEPGGDAGG